MKHSKQKFRFEKVLTPEQEKHFEQISIEVPFKPKEKVNIPKGMNAFVKTDLGKLIETFYYNNSGHHYYIPEPDPILIYFNLGHSFYREIAESRKELFKVLNSENLTENVRNQLYNYFGFSNGFVIFLFTSLEAFLNKMIPDNYIYSENKSRYTATFNKSQIERELNFDTKLKEVVNKITQKDFSKKHRPTYEHIINLKKFRDNIVHTKTQNNDNSGKTYEYLFKQALNFKYEETLLAVRDFINYYEPNYIEECDCGKDF